jgi:galactose oxidase
MPNLANAWHIPVNPEPRGHGGMRDPIGAIVPGTVVTIISGNQFQGPAGNPGNQLQDGSAIFFKESTSSAWVQVPMLFLRELTNNKYYSASIPAGSFAVGELAQYYLRIAYDDHDTTFIHANGADSATTGVEAEAQAAPFNFSVEDPADKGQWSPVFALPNVAIHAHLLPTGSVLMWGRRELPEQSLDVHESAPFIWNPKDGTTKNTDRTKANLFCSGHTFLEDGRLLVVGGHNADSDGISQASLYDATADTWTDTEPMSTPNGEAVRRWYPTATTLPNGDVLVLSGSYIDPARPAGQQTVVVDLLQIWSNGTWKIISEANGMPLNFFGLPLFPRMHVASDGRVFMSGTNDRTLLLKTTTPGEWDDVDIRELGNRDYCPSVIYNLDKFIYIGGGNDQGSHAPTAEVEIIDLKANPPHWSKTKPMNFPRRQHNATVLPDGSVLVVGGTRGGGGPNTGFNDVDAGQPVHIAEMWDPVSKNWTELAAESVDRCYHSTAVLLPDGRVLSAGGGEYRPDNVNPNLPEDSHRDAQVFSPPYLFKGARPIITSAPASIDYGTKFDVGTDQANQISKVSMIRLASVTHSFDQNLRINFLDSLAAAGKITATAPASPEVCPPGHYMLFLVNGAGVPSEGKIVQIRTVAQPSSLTLSNEENAVTRLKTPELVASKERMAAPRSYLQVYAREAELSRVEKGTQVSIGITGTCPYGIGSCWGGAYNALGRLQDVAYVNPVPDTDDSMAEVFLKDEGLPDLDRWEEQFRKVVNGSYEMRGVEVTLKGSIQQQNGTLTLEGRGPRPAVLLWHLEAFEKIQWNHLDRARKPLEPSEAGAYNTLVAAMLDLTSGQEVTITGVLKRTPNGYEVHIRSFKL